MTDRLRRERALPEGYQFGDALRDTRLALDRGELTDDEALARLQPLADVEMKRMQGWNVIEGEHFDSDADHHPVIAGAR